MYWPTILVYFFCCSLTSATVLSPDVFISILLGPSGIILTFAEMYLLVPPTHILTIVLVVLFVSSPWDLFAGVLTELLLSPLLTVLATTGLVVFTSRPGKAVSPSMSLVGLSAALLGLRSALMGLSAALMGLSTALIGLSSTRLGLIPVLVALERCLLVGPDPVRGDWRRLNLVLLNRNSFIMLSFIHWI